MKKLRARTQKKRRERRKGSGRHFSRQMMCEMIMKPTQPSSRLWCDASRGLKGTPTVLSIVQEPPGRVDMVGRPSEEEELHCVFCLLRNQDAEVNLITSLSGGAIELEHG